MRKSIRALSPFSPRLLSRLLLCRRIRARACRKTLSDNGDAHKRRSFALSLSLSHAAASPDWDSSSSNPSQCRVRPCVSLPRSSFQLTRFGRPFGCCRCRPKVCKTARALACGTHSLASAHGKRAVWLAEHQSAVLFVCVCVCGSGERETKTHRAVCLCETQRYTVSFSLCVQS